MGGSFALATGAMIGVPGLASPMDGVVVSGVGATSGVASPRGRATSYANVATFEVGIHGAAPSAGISLDLVRGRLLLWVCLIQLGLN